jgi:Cof subfamily protein (haloacid dehalogenase superfamily)
MQIQSNFKIHNNVKPFSCKKSMKLNNATVSFKNNDTVETKSFIHVSDLKNHFDNKIELVFSDIDGTIRIVTKDRFETPAGSIEAVKKLSDSNIPLVLSTARDYDDAKNITKDFCDSKAYFIVIQGAKIIGPTEEIIYSNKIVKNDSLRIVDEFQKIKKRDNLKSNIFLFSGGKAYIEKASFKEEPDIPDDTTKILKIDSFDTLMKDPDFEPNKILIVEKNIKTKEAITKELKSKLPDFNVVPSVWYTCEIMNKTVSKGEAIKILAKHLNIDLKNVAALGDGDNDYEMLTTVQNAGGLAVAMGNSSQKVLDAIKFRTDRMDNDGFKNAIDAIIQNNSRLDNSTETQSILETVKNFFRNLFTL